jgi:hypothetical protein
MVGSLGSLGECPVGPKYSFYRHLRRLPRAGFAVAGSCEGGVERMATPEPHETPTVNNQEHPRTDTLYVATAGGTGPGMIAALERVLLALSTRKDGEPVIATRLTEMAQASCPRSTRHRPAGANDWNDVLKKGRGS